MRLKSYFAQTVEAAMDQARRELGDEALLMNSRKAPPEAQALGEYEVTFATGPETAAHQRAAQATASTAAATDPVMAELARLRKQLEQMGSAFAGLNAQACHWAVPAPEFGDVFSRLLDNDFSMGTARRIVKQAYARLEADNPSRPGRKTPYDHEAINRAIQIEIAELVSVDAGVGIGDEKGQVIAVVGPPGGGKTSTLVKLAMRYGVAGSRPVHLISADTHRISGMEQLRTYAAILGVGFEAVETAQDLAKSIQANREKALIFVDTPGYAASEMEEAAELAAFLSQETAVTTHLVVPASMRASDLTRTVDRFEIFSPAKLLFTRVDETMTFGTLISESERSGKPLSFLSAGKRIPEDLEPAAVSRILETLLSQLPEQARSAA